MDSVDGLKLSEKAKDFLTKKLIKSQNRIKKLKRKRIIYKILFIGTAGTSITISVVLASISSLILPPVVVPILTISSGILTGLSVKFGFEDNVFKLKKEIEKLNKLQDKLDYVISCNGSLTDEVYMQIETEFQSL